METDDVTCCMVCSEEYTEEGEHVPRLFPCSHTACEGCINGKLLQRFSLDCPQCGASHFAPDGLDNFPINRYICAYIQKTARNLEAERLPLCARHTREENLFCDICRKPICVLCLKDEHKGHEFRVLEEVKNSGQMLLSEVRKRLGRNKRKLKSVQQKERETYQASIEQIKMGTTEWLQMIQERSEKLVADLEEKASNFDSEVESVINKMNKDLDKLDNIEKAGGLVTHENIVAHEKSLKRIKRRERNALVEIKQFSHLRYEGNRNPTKHVNKLCGKLKNQNANPPLPDKSPKENDHNAVERPSDEIEKSSASNDPPEEDDDSDANFPSQSSENGNILSNASNGGRKVVWRTASNAITIELSHKKRHTGSSEGVEEGPPIKKRRLKNSELSANRVNSRKDSSPLILNICNALAMSLLPNGRVVVLGSDSNQKNKPQNTWILGQYDVNNGTMLKYRPLVYGSIPTGLAAVTVAGHDCVAVSYREQQKIRFYDKDHFLKYTYSTRRRSKELCAILPGTLVYLTHTKKYENVRWLDCTSYPPKEIKMGTYSRKTPSFQFCFAMYGDKQLLITSKYAGGIHTYDTDTKELQWFVEGKLPNMSRQFCAQGITVRVDKNLLYVCDKDNMCIHTFSLDGRYLETPVTFNNKSRPRRMFILWCEELRSAIVCSTYPDHSEVHVVKLD